MTSAMRGDVAAFKLCLSQPEDLVAVGCTSKAMHTASKEEALWEEHFNRKFRTIFNLIPCSDYASAYRAAMLKERERAR